MWNPVLGYEALYEVSDAGQVRRRIGPFRRKEILLKPAIDHKGYQRVKLSVDGVTSTHNVHKLVAQAFIGRMPNGETVNHKDLNKTNNQVDNLEYCSRSDNVKHAYLNGRLSLSNAKLTALQVADIRSRYKPRTDSSAILAAEYGVTRRTICRIVDGTFWSHV